MISHVFIGVNDFSRALEFYQPLMKLLGYPQRFVDETRPWASWQSVPGPRPLLLIGKAFDGEAAQPGNGQMIALEAGTRAQVTAAHALALQRGGRCEGPPGLRPEYHPNYFGTYFRDAEGNKLCVVCHAAE